MKLKIILTSVLILTCCFFIGCKDPDGPGDGTKEWTVTFQTNGGTSINSQKIPNNGKVTPVVPTRDGFSFLGWYRDSNFNSVWDFENDTVTGNLTLYAEWYEIPEGWFNVSFNTNGGSLLMDQLVQEDGFIIEPIAPTKEGLHFGGWFKDAAITQRWHFATDTVTQHLTLYAKWEQKNSATITFVTNSEIEIEPLEAFTGEKIKRPRVTVRSNGQACIGWFFDNNTFQNEFDFLTMEVEGDMTLYAEWGTAVNVWLSSNHAGGFFEGQGNQAWDEEATTVPERRFLQRKDGTHYIDLTCSDTSDYYFRFMIRGTVNGVQLDGRLDPDTHDMQVIYNNPMALPYSTDLARSGRSWKFNSDGDFIILLDARNPSNRTFTLTQPYTITGVNITPETFTRDYGTAFTRQFTATVLGENPPRAITWSLEGATGGTTINQNGLVSVTAAETPKTITVRATSQIMPNITGTASLILQEPSPFPVVYEITVSPESATVMKAANANGTIQTHGSNFAATNQYRGRQFTAMAAASGGATDAVTYSIVESVKPGTQISSTGYLTVALNEEREKFTVRVASAEPDFEDVYTDIPITVQSFNVWIVGHSFSWGRGTQMDDNGDGTYTWTGEITADSINPNGGEGFSFNTNKTSGGGDSGTMGWGGDAWYNFASTTNATTNVFGPGTFTLRAGTSQANMFRINPAEVGRTFTVVLNVMVPSVTVTEVMPPSHEITYGIMDKGDIDPRVTLGYEGRNVTLTAVPEEGYYLSGVTVTGVTTPIINTGANTISFTMPAAATVVTATFALMPAITYGTMDNGDIDPKTANAYPGAAVSLTAVPDPGYYLSGVTVTGVTTPTANALTNTISFIMPDAATEVIALFTAQPAITNNNAAADADGNLLTVASSATPGAPVQITITLGDGKLLDTLTVTGDPDSATLTGSGTTRSFVMPSNAVTVTATFKDRPAPIILETFDPPDVEAGAAFSTVTGYGTSTAGTGNTATATFANDQIRAESGRTLNGKLVFVTGSGGGGGAARTARMTKTFEAMDMSDYTHITFWVRGSVVSTGAGWYTVVVGTTETTYPLAVDTWTQITLPLPANRSAITSIAFGVTGNSRNGSMWVDNVRLINQ